MLSIKSNFGYTLSWESKQLIFEYRDIDMIFMIDNTSDNNQVKLFLDSFID